MKRTNLFTMQDDLIFHNVTERRLSLDDVIERMLRFISQDPASPYQLMIGTDSQVHRGHTKFVTGIIIRRLGKGAWACYRQVVLPRELTSVKEKLTIETSLAGSSLLF